jgi:hypothetical protein
MTDPQVHIAETLVRLAASPVVKTISVTEKHNSLSYGYIRARLTLINGDFLEVAEYFIIQNSEICVKRYRYQWMNSECDILKKRWDNTKHFPQLPNFPHHIHTGSETQVIPGRVLSIIELIDFLEQEIHT